MTHLSLLFLFKHPPQRRGGAEGEKGSVTNENHLSPTPFAFLISAPPRLCGKFLSPSVSQQNHFHPSLINNKQKNQSQNFTDNLLFFLQ